MSRRSLDCIFMNTNMNVHKVRFGTIENNIIDVNDEHDGLLNYGIFLTLY